LGIVRAIENTPVAGLIITLSRTVFNARSLVPVVRIPLGEIEGIELLFPFFL
jgi:hypothetical protein